MWLQILKQGEQLSEWPEKRQHPPQIPVLCRQTHRPTHTQPSWSWSPSLKFGLRIWPADEPLCSLGHPTVLQASRSQLQYKSVCQRLQSSIIQKSVLPKPTDYRFPAVLQVIHQPSQSTSPHNGAVTCVPRGAHGRWNHRAGLAATSPARGQPSVISDSDGGCEAFQRPG